MKRGRGALLAKIDIAGADLGGGGPGGPDPFLYEE